MTLLRHGSTDVEWFASGQTLSMADGAAISFSLDPSILNSGDCLEVWAQDSTGRAVELDEVVFTHSDSGWACTPDRPGHLREAREAYFGQPLIAPEAADNARSFRVVALIEGLLLTRNTRVPGVEIYALKHVLGSEQATVSYLSALTEALLGINFPAGAHADRGLPCIALKFSDVRADTFDMVLPFALDVAVRMTDLLGFNRVARPQLIGLAALDEADSGSIRYWVEPTRTQYTGNFAGASSRAKARTTCSFSGATWKPIPVCRSGYLK